MPCNAAGALALILLAWNPAENLHPALLLLVPAAALLYGCALWRWWAERRRG